MQVWPVHLKSFYEVYHRKPYFYDYVKNKAPFHAPFVPYFLY